MNESLADIESLSLKCRSEQSKNYILEATLCYRAGAYRAAIVSTWIAVVFDLIDKIRELAISGDFIAKTLDDRFQKYIDQINEGNQQGVSKALEFEREILDVCRDKLQFFDQQQLIDLYRLREDRHRCAHPSFQQVGTPYRPSAEHARLHIRNAVIHVLSQPPVQGKAAIAGIAQLIISDFFPEDTGKAALQLKKAGMESTRDALINAVIDKLVFGFFSNSDPLYERKQVCTALNAVYEMHPGFVESRLGRQLDKIVRDIPDDRVFWALYLIVNVNQAWNLIDQVSRDKLELVVEKSAYDELSPAIDSLAKLEEFRPIIEGRIREFDLQKLSGIVGVESVSESIKSRAIHLLAESRSWDTTNSIFDKLIFPIFSIVQLQDVVNIVGLPSEYDADLLGAHAFGLFIEKVREENLMASEELNKLLEDNGCNYLLRQNGQA